MSAGWNWNDPEIPDRETIHRHVPANITRCVVVDQQNKRVQLNKNAFVADELLADGWSEFRQMLMDDNDVSIEDIERSAADPGANPREVWSANLGELRAVELKDDLKVGVVDRDDPDLGKLGKADGVIRFSAEKPSKGAIREGRELILRLFSRTSRSD